MITTILFLSLVFVGLYAIALEVFKIPSLARSGVVKSLMAEPNDRGVLNDMVYGISKKLSAVLKLSPFKREELSGKLRALDMAITAEEYTATALTKAALTLLVIIPAIMTLPLLALAVIGAALVRYFTEMHRVDKLLAEKRKLFDREVPRFARSLAENLEYNDDILAILEKYKETALSPFFRREIDRTVADAKISSLPEALVRFDERISSKYLSDVVRGLLSIINGSEGVSYFRLIVRDIKKEEYEMLRIEAMKRPDKLKKWSLAILIMIIVTLFMVMIMDALRQVQMFNSVG
jgi:hypothetical protein